MNFLKNIMTEIGSEMQKTAKKKRASFYETFPDRRTWRQQWADMAKEAHDKTWSTAREPNPNAYQFQDNCIVQLIKKFK